MKMYNIIIIFLMVIIFSGGSQNPAYASNYAPESILVKEIGCPNIKSVHLSQYESVEEKIAEYSQKSNIEWAEPNFTYKMAIIPSDTYYENQWYLKKIKSPEAWNIIRESPDIIIAIIDTGVQIGHPDLKENIWINTNEIENNNLDDDKNGYIDDINGWDFVNNNPDPQPKFKTGYTQDGILHGTVVAGIAAASGNNASGISGVSWRAKIMSLKALGDSGEGDTGSVVKAINYAVDNGADLINLSFVGTGFSKSLESAIRRAYENGVIVVAAAGNEQNEGHAQSLDEIPLYPVCYDGEKGENMVVGVTATDAMDQKTPFAGYGLKCIDIAAPGVSFFSTSVYQPAISADGSVFDKYYDGYWSGTSMAVPVVTGAIALIEQSNPNLYRHEVISILNDFSENLNRLNPNYLMRLGSGRINLNNSLTRSSGLIRSRIPEILIAPQSDYDNKITKIDVKGNKIFDFSVYGNKFNGGLNVASGDFNGDGKNEFVTGAGPGGGPHIKVFDNEGKLIRQFFAYDKNFKGGVNVAAGNMDKDKNFEIICSPQTQSSAQVKIFEQDGKLIRQFFAYDKNFKGGVNVAAGNIDGYGSDEIVTAPNSGGGSHIKIFNNNGILQGQFFAYESSYKGGSKVAVADINQRVREHKAEIIISPVKNYSPLIKIFDGRGKLINQFMAYDKKFKNGVSIAANDINHDGQAEIITAAGPGGAPHVRIFQHNGFIIGSFYALDGIFNGGLNIGYITN